MSPINQEEQQVILDFVIESLEMLESLESTLIQLETTTEPDEIQEIINLIFRPFHNLKGGAGFLNLLLIQKVAHTVESLLQNFRTDVSSWKPQYVDVLIQSFDLLNTILQQVQEEFHDEGFEDQADDLIKIINIQLNNISADKEETLIEEESEVIEEEILAEDKKGTSISLVETLTRSLVLFQKVLSSRPNVFDFKDDFYEVEFVVEALEKHLFSQVNNLRKDLPEQEQKKYLFDLPEPPFDKTDQIASGGQQISGIQEFIKEAKEHLETAEGVLLVIEKIGTDIDIDEYLHSALRSFHTIKGSAGFLALEEIEAITHKTEKTLEALLEEKVSDNSNCVQILLEVVDLIREYLIFLETGSQIDPQRIEYVLKELDNIDITFNETKIGDIMLKMGKVTEQDIEKAVQQQNIPIGNILVQMGKATDDDVKEALKQQAVEKERIEGQPKKKEKKQTNVALPKTEDIRVSLNKLDQLIDLVGELIISETMISNHADLERAELESLKNASNQLRRNMLELQEVAMSMRMVPISGLFRKMVRVIRDTSKKLGKKVELKVLGEKSEVDKTLVEQVADPLLHIIRNAVDHGLEMPKNRADNGKDETGNILLEARHVGNEIWIIVQDDGKGMDRDKIRNKAIEKGLIHENDVHSDEEIWKMIFAPGFSTAEVVTDFSGRGVGMDVVRRNIEKLGGSIDIRSKLGTGSTFTLKLPLTLSIVDGLLVKVGDTSCALPTITIRETLRPEKESITQTMSGSEMLRVRENILPILRLHNLYNIEPEETELSKGMLLLIEQGEQAFCLFVDSVIGQQQIVIKSLPESMIQVPHLAGCTILGEGEVGLILDAASLTRVAMAKKNRMRPN